MKGSFTALTSAGAFGRHLGSMVALTAAEHMDSTADVVVKILSVSMRMPK